MRSPWSDSDGDVIEPSTLHWLDPLIVALGFATYVTEATHRTLVLTLNLLMAQSNTAYATEVFTEEAMREIESFITEYGEDDDA